MKIPVVGYAAIEPKSASLPSFLVDGEKILGKISFNGLSWIHQSNQTGFKTSPHLRTQQLTKAILDF